jgi:hypothetical protein
MFSFEPPEMVKDGDVDVDVSGKDVDGKDVDGKDVDGKDVDGNFLICLINIKYLFKEASTSLINPSY